MFRYVDPTRLAVLQRDNFTCQACGYKAEMDLKAFSIFGGLEVHHIDGNRRNNDPTNLKTLCAHCHLYVAHRGHYHNKETQRAEEQEEIE